MKTTRPAARNIHFLSLSLLVEIATIASLTIIITRSKLVTFSENQRKM